MSWNIVVRLYDSEDTQLAETVTEETRDLTWQIPVKMAFTEAFEEHAAIDWKKATLTLEKVDAST